MINTTPPIEWTDEQREFFAQISTEPFWTTLVVPFLDAWERATLLELGKFPEQRPADGATDATLRTWLSFIKVIRRGFPREVDKWINERIYQEARDLHEERIDDMVRFGVGVAPLD